MKIITEQETQDSKHNALMIARAKMERLMKEGEPPHIAVGLVALKRLELEEYGRQMEARINQ